MGTEELLNNLYETVDGKASQQQPKEDTFFPSSAYKAILQHMYLVHALSLPKHSEFSLALHLSTILFAAPHTLKWVGEAVFPFSMLHLIL